MKLKVMFALLMGLFVLVGCSREREEERKPFTYFEEINESTLAAKIQAGETFYVYIGRPDCGDSWRFEEEFRRFFVNPSSDKVLYDLDTKIYYFNVKTVIDKMSDVEARVALKEKYGFYYTPSLVAYASPSEGEASEIVSMAEWTAIDQFYPSDYMFWFYENGLVVPNQNVHEGPSTHVRGE